MRTIMLALGSLLLVACGEDEFGTLHLEITSDDPPLAAAEGSEVNLTTVKEIHVVVGEISVHLSGSDEAEPTEGVADTDGGWTVVDTTVTPLDLMTLRTDATKHITDIVLPEGKVTQIRMKLATAAEVVDGDQRIAGTVVDLNGSLCDLVVPASAADPGIKLIGMSKAISIEASQEETAVVNLKLSDASRIDTFDRCAFRLNPVLRIDSTL